MLHLVEQSDFDSLAEVEQYVYPRVVLAEVLPGGSQVRLTLSREVTGDSGLLSCVWRVPATGRVLTLFGSPQPNPAKVWTFSALAPTVKSGEVLAVSYAPAPTKPVKDALLGAPLRAFADFPVTNLSTQV